jgi:hypothetical protein
LAPFEATSDPTLRAGDIVATKGGLLAYTGGRGQGAAFAPVDDAAVTAELRARTRIFESRNGEGIPSVTQRE